MITHGEPHPGNFVRTGDGLLSDLAVYLNQFRSAHERNADCEQARVELCGNSRFPS